MIGCHGNGQARRLILRGPMDTYLTGHHSQDGHWSDALMGVRMVKTDALMGSDTVFQLNRPNMVGTKEHSVWKQP